MIPTKLLVIGAGPAGYTAAIYAARALLAPILIDGPQPGGQLTVTTDVENYPGFAEPIQGPWLMDQMRAQAEHVGARIVADIVASVDLSKPPFKVACESGETYLAESLIIATGAQAKWLGLPSETTFRGFGVSACATCDGFFFRNRTVMVVGGGNTAVEDALFLTRFAAKVMLVHRRGELRAEKILQERLFSHPKVEMVWHHEVADILGEGTPLKVTGARLKDVRSGALRDVPVDGVFVAIGHSPATELFREQLKTKPNGYLWVAPYSTATSVPGVFAAGDVTDDAFRQAVTAAGMGCMAALEAQRYLAEQEHSAEHEHAAAPAPSAAVIT